MQLGLGERWVMTGSKWRRTWVPPLSRFQGLFSNVLLSSRETEKLGSDPGGAIPSKVAYSKHVL